MADVAPHPSFGSRRDSISMAPAFRITWQWPTTDDTTLREAGVRQKKASKSTECPPNSHFSSCLHHFRNLLSLSKISDSLFIQPPLSRISPSAMPSDRTVVLCSGQIPQGPQSKRLDAWMILMHSKTRQDLKLTQRVKNKADGCWLKTSGET